MQKYICSKTLVDVLRQHIITKKRFSNQAISEVDVQKEVFFILKTLRSDETGQNCITLKTNQRFLVEDDNTLVFYMGFNNSIHEFEVFQGKGGFAKTHNKCIQCRNNDIIQFGNKYFLVLGDTRYVNLLCI